ncbi:hypothetical protein NP511_02075 [Natrinema thermotolerans]|uniref:Uncharacterized protein n=1 Tax=Natrinema thermotolerans TaxID=121872 RepID=A0AAF0PFL2_9EURY|nr:hypothetical protein [Natrinema thermotolerans]WPH65848.1 hypothetical protein HJTV4_gp25 [Haloarchaeal virus HJTV-4]QCC60753.1 hypothetical protein DVR14_19770 [Natrinema thermotolerans]QCC61631.1 hypothetical protein DVR14_23900 [Natrinema thermotolerans]WMT07798.1 hypothetical protein NP511_20790 [Natrinema thermotolerans]WMT08430.1 hypothetical protein NP511_02075 [Natrinema thermotolerans]
MPETTVTVRVAGAQFRFDREQYTRGDELEVPERIVGRHPRTLEIVDDVNGDEEAADAGDGTDELTVDDLDPHPKDLDVPGLEDRIADVDDVSLLETIKEAEKQNDDRTTAKNAIDSRLNELEG